VSKKSKAPSFIHELPLLVNDGEERTLLVKKPYNVDDLRGCLTRDISSNGAKIIMAYRVIDSEMHLTSHTPWLTREGHYYHSMNNK